MAELAENGVHGTAGRKRRMKVEHNRVSILPNEGEDFDTCVALPVYHVFTGFKNEDVARDESRKCHA